MGIEHRSTYCAYGEIKDSLRLRHRVLGEGEALGRWGLGLSHSYINWDFHILLAFCVVGYRGALENFKQEHFI